MIGLAEVLIQLKDSPHVGLMIFLMFGVDCVQFSRCAGWCEQWAMEERCEAFQSAWESIRRYIKVIVSIRCRCIGIRGSIVFRQVL